MNKLLCLLHVTHLFYQWNICCNGVLSQIESEGQLNYFKFIEWFIIFNIYCLLDVALHSDVLYYMYPLFSQRNSQGSFFSSSLKEYYKRWVTKYQLKVCALPCLLFLFGITGCRWSNIAGLNISWFYKLIWYVYANLNHFLSSFQMSKASRIQRCKVHWVWCEVKFGLLFWVWVSTGFYKCSYTWVSWNWTAFRDCYLLLSE